MPREEIEITSKVAFFPKNSAGVTWYNANNEKDGEEASIDLCLEQLGVDYIDLLLVHSPVCTVPEYKVASMPHFFELFGIQGQPNAVKPATLPDGEKIRPLLLSKKLQDAREAGIDFDANLEQRKRTWAAMEKALKAGKCKMIGVSNYPAPLIAEMDSYATVMPAMNQLEFNPRFASPAVQEACNKRGIKLTAYGTCFSTLID